MLYADDILLLAPSVTALQKLLWAYEQEFHFIAMPINVKKSCCMRNGARHGKLCANIRTLDGRDLAWVEEIRYLGVLIVRSFRFKRCVDQAQKVVLLRCQLYLCKSRQISFGRSYITTVEAEMFAGSSILSRGV